MVKRTCSWANLLGQYGSNRTVGGRTYAPGERIAKLDALREARAWLRGLTLEEAEAAQRKLELDASTVLASATRGGGGQRRTGAAAGAAPIHPYEHPYYWAAFVLLGSPE